MDRSRYRSPRNKQPQNNGPSIGILSISQAFIAFVVLCLIVLPVVRSLQAPSWVPGLEMISWIAFAGMLGGVLLATFKGQYILVHFVGLGTGALLVSICVSSLIEQDLLRDRLAVLWLRLAAWMQVAIGGGIATDNLLFLLSMAAIAWILGYMSAWTVFRLGTAWWAVLGGGMIVLINVSYVRELAPHVVVFWVGALALASLMNFVKRERHWRKNNVDYTSALGGQVFRWSLVVGLLVVAVTWAAPSINATDQLYQMVGVMTGPWQKVEGEFTRVFGGIGFPGGSAAPGTVGSTLALKGPVRLGDEPILEVASSEALYLKGAIYEQYTGRGWLAAEATPYEVPANDDRLSGGGEYLLRRTSTYTVKVLAQRSQNVYYAGEPKTTSVPVLAELDLSTVSLQDRPSALELGAWQTALSLAPARLPDSFLEPRGVSGMRAFTPEPAGFQYQISSSISNADLTNLRRAGTDYPQWVKDRFLTLPPTLPKRVGELAQMVVSGEDNPYDKASALETYLRQYAYTLDLPAPPPDEDAVSYFLFDARKGYCDYYASAMAVMLRAVGVPSRLISGYAPGNYDSTTGHYIVTDAQAHTWVEAYFPGLGWVEFEPTSSRTEILRPAPGQEIAMQSALGTSVDVDIPSLEESLGDQYDPTLPGTAQSSGDIWRTIQAMLPWIGMVFLASAALFTFIRYVWLRGLSGLPLSQSLYARMCRLSQWIGVRQVANETPNEYAQRLSLLVPEAKEPIGEITNSYVRSVFGARMPNSEVRSDLIQAWRTIQGRFLASALLVRLRSRGGALWRKK